MQQEVEAELKVPFREDDLVDIVSDPAGEVLAADGVVVSISPDGGRAMVAIMNVYFPREVAGGATSSSGGEIRVNGVLLVPGETVKLRSSALRRKDWRDTLNVAVERQVEHLDLGRYFFELDSFPAEILSLSNLRKLELNLNSLTSLPPEIAYLENLEEFNLAHNQIAHLPVEICQLQSLKVLDLRSNGLMELPEEINQLVELTTLYVQDNKMRTLPATIGELPKLQSLFLNNNMLLSVPDETGNCVSLEMVNFRGNRKLQDLPMSFGQLINLWWLGLDRGFAGVPADITDNPRRTASYVRESLNSLATQ